MDIYALGCVFGELRDGRGFFPSEDDFQRLCALHAFVGPMPQTIAIEGRETCPGYFIFEDERLDIAWRKRLRVSEYQFFEERRKTFNVRGTLAIFDP